jgi:hypothetical protein
MNEADPCHCKSTGCTCGDSVFTGILLAVHFLIRERSNPSAMTVTGSTRAEGMSAARFARACAHDTGADLAKSNVNGRAIAIGHPLGASGARIMTTLVSALDQRGGRYGLQTMCEGGGMANATIIERLD